MQDCTVCGRPTPSYAIVHFTNESGLSRETCTRCCNDAIARGRGLTSFETTPFDPLVLRCAQGVERTFHVSTRLLGTGIVMKAFEVEDEVSTGYRFQVIDAVDSDQMELLAVLTRKVRQGISRQWLEDDDLGLQLANNGTELRGQLEWDDERDGRAPCVIVDGRAVSWAALGKILASFEGFEMRLTLHDFSDPA